MKIAIIISTETLPLISILNHGVEPGITSKESWFIYDSEQDGFCEIVDSTVFKREYEFAGEGIVSWPVNSRISYPFQ